MADLESSLYAETARFNEPLSSIAKLSFKLATAGWMAGNSLFLASTIHLLRQRSSSDHLMQAVAMSLLPYCTQYSGAFKLYMGSESLRNTLSSLQFWSLLGTYPPNDGQVELALEILSRGSEFVENFQSPIKQAAPITMSADQLLKWLDTNRIHERFYALLFTLSPDPLKLLVRSVLEISTLS